MQIIVNIKRLDEKFSDIPLPKYISEGAAGMDICATLDEPMTIAPGAIAIVPTSLAIALPKGYECQVRSRSGLAAKNGIFALNAPGTVDSDYRGEIGVILANFGKEIFSIKRGDRIAQIVIAKYETALWRETESLDETERGAGGFGSSGI